MSNAGVIQETCLRPKDISFVVGPFVAIPMQQEKGTEAISNFIKKENNRYYLCGGAIWPSNDANAKGIVAWDKDITDGSVTFSLIVDGNVRVELLPAAPSAAAVSALQNISFIPKQDGEIPSYFQVILPTVSNGEIEVGEGSSLIVLKGGSFSFTVDAETGYHVSAVTANGDDLTPDEDGVYTIEDIDADQNIAVTTEADT